MLQIGTLVLLVANMFEIIDVICRTKWSRVQGPKIIAGYHPKVSLHVPIHSEPPELVIETLNALASLHYRNYEVLVIDNNTVGLGLSVNRRDPRFRGPLTTFFTTVRSCESVNGGRSQI